MTIDTYAHVLIEASELDYAALLASSEHGRPRGRCTIHSRSIVSPSRS